MSPSFWNETGVPSHRQPLPFLDCCAQLQELSEHGLQLWEVTHRAQRKLLPTKVLGPLSITAPSLKSGDGHCSQYYCVAFLLIFLEELVTTVWSLQPWRVSLDFYGRGTRCRCQLSSLSPVLEGLTGPDTVSRRSCCSLKIKRRAAEFILIGRSILFQPCCPFIRRRCLTTHGWSTVEVAGML